MMKRRNTIALSSLLVLALMGTAVHAATIGSRFDPNDYASNGVLTVLAGDTITFDTDTLDLSWTITGSAPASGTGVVATSQSQLAGAGGNASLIDGVSVQLAMFNFDSINIASGATVVVQGNLGLSLGSLGDMTIGTNIRVNGAGGLAGGGGAGGAGAEGGVNAVSFSSNPPGETAGDGGNDGGNTNIQSWGIEFGGGRAPGGANNGDGAAYGGTGGGDFVGDDVYGDEQLTLLFGGSGGGGSGGTSNANNSGGGGGGGSIELTAVGTLTLSAVLSSNGGAGTITAASGTDLGSGGGSGGGLLLSADDIILTDTALLSATGGGGGAGTGADGGGGAGGRIAIYAGNSLIIDGESIGDGALITDVLVDPSVNVNGGANGDSAAAGDGTLYISVVPEPATMSLLALGGIAMLKRRRN